MDYERPVDRDSDTENSNLGLEIASGAAATGRAGAIPLLPDADNIVALPEGATLDDVAVRGRDLVIEVEGKTYIIPDGAIFVPVLVVDGVAVPPLNLAAYLNESQPQPAAGNPQSSGGNFFDPAAPIQPAYGLGNLLPYTELAFPESEDEEVFSAINNEPEITFVPRVGEIASGTRVEEAGLASSTVIRDSESPGSQDESDVEITANTIDFTSLDGVETVTINGVVIDPNGLPQVVSSDEVGTLIITGYTFDDATKTGSITYEYTLNDNTLDPGGSEVSFPIVVTDPDGDVAEDVLAIEIVDDIPTAVEDFDSVGEGGTATGNVLPNDEFGADGPATTAPEGGVIGVRAADGDTETPVETGTGTEIRGLYGTLVLNADGSYTYKSDANIIDTDVVDVFVYTIEDGDEGEGDISTTTLTIDISAITLLQHDVGVIVDEAALDLNQDGADLAPGDTTGRTPGSTDETVGGTVVIAGAAAFEIVGSSEGTYGLISIDNDGNFIYTLTSRFDNLPHADDGTETQPAGDVFTYLATDANGNTVEGTITVDIIDDIPVATADVDTVSEGGTAVGNVLPNDAFGADGPATTAPLGGVIGVRKADGDTTTDVTTGTGTEIFGDYGTLILNADGSYTYVTAPGTITEDVVEIFVYTIEDDDGDRSTTTLTITVDDVTLIADDENVTVYEPSLDLFQTGDDLAPGIVTGSAPGNTLETVSGALDVPGATSFAIVGTATGTYGLIQINADGSYTYTLTTPVDNLPHANDGHETAPAQDVFTYEASDDNGNVIEGTITVDIVDDVPIARADFNSVDELGTVLGNVLPNDAFGADGPDVTSPAGGVVGVRAAGGDTTTPVTTGTGGVIVGLYGTLTLDADGSYSYQAGSVTADVQDVFVYSIRDSDGDLSTTTLTILVGDTFVPPPDNPAVITGLVPELQGGDAIVDEDDLVIPEGSDQSQSTTVTGSFFISAPDGVDDVVVDGINVFINGVFQANATGTTSELGNTIEFTGYNAGTGEITYEYTLDDNEAHSNANGQNSLFDHLAVSLTDIDGDSDADTLVVQVVDDVPTANDDGIFNVEAGVAYQINSAFVNDVFGADGVDTTNAIPSSVVVASGPSQGTAVYNDDGTFTYTANQNAVGADSFTYTITDGDGDPSTATITVNIGEDSTPSGGTAYALVDDDGLPGGNPNSTVNDLDTNEGQDQSSGTVDDDADGLASSEKTFSGALNFSPGSDTPVTVSFHSDMLTATPTVGQETVSFALSGGGTILTATGPRGDLFKVTLTDTAAGTYTVELLDNVLHATRDGESDDDTENLTVNDAVATIKFNVVDFDSSPSASDVLLQITFDDDAPSSFVVEAAELENSVDGTVMGSLDVAPGDGNILNNIGADGGSVIFDPSLEGASSGLTSGFQPIIYDVSASGQILYGKVGANTVFTITLDQANSNYTIDMDDTFGTVDSNVQIDYDPGAFDLVGGNGAWFGIVPTGQGDGGGDAPVNDNSQDVLITPLSADTINTSNILGGVGGGQSVDPGEGFRLDYVVDLTGSPPNSNYVIGGTNGHSFDEHWTTNGATISFRQSTSGTTMRFEAFDDEGADDANNVVGDGDQEAITNIVIFYNNDESTLLTPTGLSQNVSVGGETFGYQLDGLSVLVTNVTGANGNSNQQLTTTIAIYTADGYTTLEATNEDPLDGGNSIKFGGFGAAVETESPVEFSVPLLIMDEDGDKTATSDLDITLNPVVVNPVVLDLDGDGVEFLSQDAGVTFDYGTGLVATAWAGADDGLLARQTAQGLDIVFSDDAPGAATDLEGVREAYDGNDDGVLTSADAAWGDFGVWQDADSDGVTDAGEFRSLDDLGIVSIELTSDGEGYSAADGDVTVHGEAAFTTAGGATGVLADASFAVGAQKIETRSLEITNAAIAAGVMASALLVEAPDAEAKGTVTTDSSPRDVPMAALSETVASDGGEEAGISSQIYLGDATGELAGDGGSSSSEVSDGEMSDAGLADLIDHYSGGSGDESPSESHVEASSDLVSGGNSDGGEVMQSLLLLSQVTPVEDASGDLDYLGEAIVEAEGENFVDHLIDELGSGEADSTEGSIDGLQLLLATDVDSVPAVGQGAFEFNDMAEELSAAAAAA
ncbi:MAG: VCBS domain-containing protein [Sphingomonadaceae bacterium]|nr:VCBS domain-containing protein [Sphingomonadaceae bacterium]